MDLHGRITAHVWGKIIPKEASDCADFILESPARMETRQALADLVAAAEPIGEIETWVSRGNALCEIHAGGTILELEAGKINKFLVALSRARKVMKGEA